MSEKKQSTGPETVYIDEVAHHQRRYLKWVDLTHSTTKAAGVMLLGAIIALIIANTTAHGPFVEFWHTEITIGFGAAASSMSLAHIINDVLMALFFLLVGLEIKYEMTVGELTDLRQAILPIAAAIGGVLAPVAIYLFLNASSPETMGGWGVPTATDIAFALGILALLGDRVPSGVRVFLSTLAVADDIIAILVIAIFYGHSPDLMWLLFAGVVFIALIVMNKAHVYALLPYLLLGVVLWFCIFSSGVHSTIAGVLLAFAIPSGTRVNLASYSEWSHSRMAEVRKHYTPHLPVIGQADYLDSVSRLARVSLQVIPPATRLERMLYPWVYFCILPLFALTNADVAFLSGDMGMLFASPVFLGVFFGLLLGKPLGICLMSLIIVKTKIASLPENVNWAHIVGAALLGGVGFTMAIFVANLAFVSSVDITAAKVAILAASLLAGILGFVFLSVQAKIAADRNQHFEPVIPEGSNLQTHDAHNAARRAYGVEHIKRRDADAQAEETLMTISTEEEAVAAQGSTSQEQGVLAEAVASRVAADAVSEEIKRERNA